MLNTQQLKAIYSNEQVLLLLLTRLYFSTDGRAEVETFLEAHPINWARFLHILRAHGLRSFIYGVIITHQIKLDDKVVAGLKMRYGNNRLKNFGQIQAAINLIGEFKNRGIRAIPYKGAIFAQNYYTDIALRESSDIDFLISKADIKSVEAFFIDQQYLPKTTVPRAYLNYYSTFFKDIVYYKPEAIPTSIEMHWRLVDRYAGNYPTYSFFSPHLVSTPIGGVAIDTLAPTYNFLAVASNHFVKDMNIKFKYLIDIACMLIKEGEALDIGVINRCAHQYGFEKKLSVGLNQINQLLGIKLTGLKEVQLSDGLLQTPLLCPIQLTRLYINEPAFIKYALTLQDNFFNKVKFIARCFFYAFLPTYADINEYSLPVVFLPALIIIRPLRLLYQVLKPAKA